MKVTGNESTSGRRERPGPSASSTIQRPISRSKARKCVQAPSILPGAANNSCTPVKD